MQSGGGKTCVRLSVCVRERARRLGSMKALLRLYQSPIKALLRKWKDMYAFECVCARESETLLFWAMFCCSNAVWEQNEKGEKEKEKEKEKMHQRGVRVRSLEVEKKNIKALLRLYESCTKAVLRLYY